jgi:hypothetical protein
MTFEDLDAHLRDHFEQLAFDAGCRWVEEFRDERGRDPEPEECDEEAALAAERLGKSAREELERAGVTHDNGLLADIRRALAETFAEALEL